MMAARGTLVAAPALAAAAVMDPLYATYKDGAVFIHIEPFDLPQLRQANLMEAVQAMREWNLQTEPWGFVVGRGGRVAAKFEGIIGAGEVEQALVAALAGPPAGGAARTAQAVS